MTSPVSTDPLWKLHVHKIVEAILAGKVVPFLGADINLCDRPKRNDGTAEVWTIDSPFPPSNQELAIYLDSYSAEMGPTYRHELSCPYGETEGLEHLPEGCPLRRGDPPLRLPVQNVSQYLASGEGGDDALDAALINLFEKEYQPNCTHRFLASLPSLLRSRSQEPNYPLIVSTCFDNALERAFAAANEPVDVVSFIGDAQGGHFQHQTPNDMRIDISDPNTYSDLDLEKRPVILRLYGGYASSSFQITEDHYIDYLSHRGIAELIPSSLLRILRADDTCLWFLGYSLGLWNQRVILRRLWQKKIKESGKTWWAIKTHPDQLEQRIWKRYMVRMLPNRDLQLEDYIADIDQSLRATPTLAPVATATSGNAGAPARSGIFFSYSHEDKKWLEQIKKFLAPAVRAGLVSEWDDTQILPGSKWRKEIQAALASAKVAVLLVSTPFLNSEFIDSEELPVLLKAAEEEGVIIFPILIDACDLEYSALKDYQFVNDPSNPLATLPPAKRSKILVDIAHKILASLPKTVNKP
ncbi:MAG: toll/interleukin-1 receptor domain-containing protein [Cyanobacteriota bacterium]|nr:toll/interleukin-1 receptor domain-containing protein [Cyanobacteriota bacterium]